MNDIEILISALENLKEKINFDHNKERFENNTYKSAINYALATIKERQADKDRIKELQKQANELVDDYEEQLSEKNNYIFQLENEREALHKLIDEEMG